MQYIPSAWECAARCLGFLQHKVVCVSVIPNLPFESILAFMCCLFCRYHPVKLSRQHRDCCWNIIVGGLSAFIRLCCKAASVRSFIHPSPVVSFSFDYMRRQNSFGLRTGYSLILCGCVRGAGVPQLFGPWLGSKLPLHLFLLSSKSTLTSRDVLPVGSCLQQSVLTFTKVWRCRTNLRATAAP